MIDRQSFADSEDRMKKTVEAVERELAAIRTGHAHVGLVDHVRVEYFGSMMPLNQMATVAAPEARLLTIQPWDRNALTRHREGAAEVGPRPDAVERRPDHPPRHPAADRAAPQGADQARAQRASRTAASPCATCAATASST